MNDYSMNVQYLVLQCTNTYFVKSFYVSESQVSRLCVLQVCCVLHLVWCGGLHSYYIIVRP